MGIVLGVIVVAVAYLIGSIPWPLIVSKVIFKKNINDLGLKNANINNIINAFGLKWGIIIICLDFLKTIFAMIISLCFEPNALSYAGVAVCAGHSFPLFTDFKGERAIAPAFGFLLGVSIFTESDFVFTFIYPLLSFLAILFLIKYLCIAALGSLIISTIISFMTNDSILISIEILLITLLVFYKYRTNLYKLVKGKEPKVSFIK